MIPRDFHFGSPLEAIYFLGMIPLLLLMLWGIYNKKRARSLLIQDPLQPFVAKIETDSSTLLNSFLYLAGFALVVLALMDPLGNEQYSSEATSAQTIIQKPSMDLLIALDTSSSMGVKDGRAGSSRLDQAKDIIDQLLGRLKNDQVALYSFTNVLTPIVPLTYDTVFARIVLKEVGLNEGDHYGTNFKTALEMLQNEISSTKSSRAQAILIISDGENRAEDPLKDLEGMHVPILTVGMGTKEGGAVPDVTQGGKEVISKLDSRFLEELSKASSSRYFPASNLSSLDTAERIEQSLEKYRLNEFQGGLSTASHGNFQKYFQIPLAVAILFFLMAYYLPRFLPFICLFIAPLDAKDPGETLYQSGQYLEAAKWYEGELLHLPPVWLEDKLLYNEATSLIAAHDYEDAISVLQGISPDAYTYSLFRVRILYNLVLALLKTEKIDAAHFVLDLVDEPLLEPLKQSLPPRQNPSQESAILGLHVVNALPKITSQARSQIENRLKTLKLASASFPETELSLVRGNLKIASNPEDFLRTLILELIILKRQGVLSTLYQDASSFYPFLLLYQQKRFKSGECQCSPWDEVIPIFIEGQQMLLQGPNPLVFSYTYNKWREALKKIKSPPKSTAKSDVELSELQKMQSMDKKPTQGGVKKTNEGLPW